MLQRQPRLKGKRWGVHLVCSGDYGSQSRSEKSDRTGEGMSQGVEPHNADADKIRLKEAPFIPCMVRGNDFAVAEAGVTDQGATNSAELA